MELPIRTEARTSDPTLLVLYSHTKVGKTSLVSKLPNCLIIDIEDGSEYVEGVKYNLVRESSKTGKGKAFLLKELAKAITEANKKINDYHYDFIVIDTMTALEELSRKVATYNYKKSAVGENYTGDDVVMDLDFGAGYEWQRKAFIDLLRPFYGLARRGLILLGHVKYSSMKKNGKELATKDLALAGKLKLIIASEATAIGYLYRHSEKPNEVWANFITSETDLFNGSRVEHLAKQEFLISKKTPEGLVTYWDLIYKNLGVTK